MKKYLFLIIIILATVLRLVALSEYPSGLNADEAALGYNAFSLLTTGKDEHGHLWPVNLESFGDFKPALYTYVLIPFIKVLGLNELAVRLPSVIFGVISVILLYYLSRLIFPNDKYIPHISALFLAISPWAIHFSRGGWETNLATTLFLMGIYLFINWVEYSKTKYLFYSLISFVLSLYAYQSAKVIAPLLVIGLLIIYRQTLSNHFRQFLKASILPTLMLIPLVLTTFSSTSTSRFFGVGLLADIGPINRVNEFRGVHSAKTYLIGKILYNKPVAYTLRFIQNYYDHFSPKYLFISGDQIARSRVPETGLFYLTDFIFLALGIIYLIRFSSKYTNLIWLWLFISPIASALTFQTPSALRSFSMVIPMILIISSGLSCLLENIRNNKILTPLIISLIIIYCYQTSRYLHEYYIHYPKEYPAAWEYGYKELVPYVESVKNNYNQILVTDKYDQPYILFLFYSKYSPEKFQDHHVLTFRDKYNFSTVRDYDKYHFSSTPWEKVRDVHSSLIIAAPEDIPEVGVNVVKTIYFPNGDPAFKIVSN
jgi:4-amino-4-deoxy-L-arabinose transferase-like glycosyltransferase